LDTASRQEIVEEHFLKGRPVKRLIDDSMDAIDVVDNMRKTNFFKGQELRIVMENSGIINPEEIDEYIGRDGYQALGKVLTEMTPEQVVDEIKTSELRGRGGGGFPTGLKWGFVANEEADQKFVVCNADEGDPGAFMDRNILEGDPHRVLEAMAIAGYAIGANHGIIYCRAEYPLAISRLKLGIKTGEEYGLLGDNILETDFSFKLEVRVGAGAFVCGEETALLRSILVSLKYQWELLYAKLFSKSAEEFQTAKNSNLLKLVVLPVVVFRVSILIFPWNTIL